MSTLTAVGVGFAIGLFVAWCSAAEEETGVLAGEPLTESELRSQIEKLVQDELRVGKPQALAVGIVIGDQRTFFGFGQLSQTEPNPPTAATTFEIASVTKTLTGLLLAEMVERGEVRLSDPAQGLLPAAVKLPTYEGKEITLVDLATHTSGLPRLPVGFKPQDLSNPYQDLTLASLYESLQKTTLKESPGTTYAYSNLGFGLLGHVLALRTGETYESLLRERICDPLGMTDTRIVLTESQQSRLARPHSRGKAVPLWDIPTLAGCGAVRSTTDDLLTYLMAHWQKEESPLTRGMERAMRKRRVAGSSSMSIGLGWHILSENTLDIVWHNGQTGGTRSYVAMLPEREVGVVVLSNSTAPPVEDIGKGILWLLVKQAGPPADEAGGPGKVSQVGEVVAP